MLFASKTPSDPARLDDADAAAYRTRCKELEAALTETRAALDDFQLSSKELEHELEKELEETEKQYKELKRRNEKLAHDADDWKAKYQIAKTESAASLAAMQREIDALREAHRIVKDQLRDVEVSNDDMERNERVVQSSLQDLQRKYNESIEQTAMLEAELAAKESLEIETQRLRDELRDTNLELSIIKDKHRAVSEDGSRRTPPSPPASEGSASNMLDMLSTTGSIRSKRLGNLLNHQRAPSDTSDRPISRTELNHSKSRKAMQDMVGRSLEARLQSCRNIVAPLMSPQYPRSCNGSHFSLDAVLHESMDVQPPRPASRVSALSDTDHAACRVPAERPASRTSSRGGYVHPLSRSINESISRPRSRSSVSQQSVHTLPPLSADMRPPSALSRPISAVSSEPVSSITKPVARYAPNLKQNISVTPEPGLEVEKEHANTYMLPPKRRVSGIPRPNGTLSPPPQTPVPNGNSLQRRRTVGSADPKWKTPQANAPADSSVPGRVLKRPPTIREAT
ncbi:Nuclear distribution protein nudE 1 [Neolecta irregularis DAH-3]|uniref:Nuclear distribution protein nudE 1 n=1 Tax=Neolecta irregularis (strain DAH-3) TaxID=1198029 RepID=A0A1U7LVH5_NEOID|nr:Nuclear distribution protein nudE 1 [Neolecta irregularis DAH-3]|eukprot:OLL26644.1 Nuclear distribution protein nudE 1 [Neolecta irregularis DAH-3]